MHGSWRSWALVASAALAAAVTTGCSNAKLVEQKDAEIAELQAQVRALEDRVEKEREEVARLNADLDEALSEMKAKEQAWIEEREGLTHVTLDGEVTFASGSARLTEAGKRMLDRIWEVVRKYPDRDVLIEGHTDDVPIAPKFRSRFRSNWELSSARAHSVLHYVVETFGVDPKRIAAVGYGEYRPIADNATEEGRARNRRVVITIGRRLPPEKALP